MAIQKLRNFKINDEIKTIYEFDEYTLQELLCEFSKTININISNIDLLQQAYDYLLSVGLPLEVQKEIIRLYEDGTLADIINNTIFGEINRKLDLLITEEDVNIILVDGINGNDSNDGFTAPVKTSQRAFQILCGLGSKSLFRQWKMKFMAGYYSGVKIADIPQFSKPLIIEGTRNPAGEIESVFSYDGSLAMGLWFEPMKGNSIKITDLRFQGFEVGFNGYGVLGKNQGYLLVVNCEADNCDCGFAGVNNVTLTCQKTIARDCGIGFKSLYLSACTIGAGTGGAHMSDGGNGCEAHNCENGMFVSRNSVAHSDFVKYFNCDVGVKVEMNSRVATLGCIFDTCTHGCEVQGGAELILGTGAEKDAFTNCRVPYDMRGVGKLSRPYSQTCKNEFLFDNFFPSHMTNTQITGTTEIQEVLRTSPSVASIPEYLLDSVNSKVRVKIYGRYKMPEGSRFDLQVKLVGIGDDNKVNGADINMGILGCAVHSTASNPFLCEFEGVFTETTHIRLGSFNVSNTTGGDAEKRVVYNTGLKAATAGKKQIRVYCTNSTTDVEVNIDYIEVYMTN